MPRLTPHPAPTVLAATLRRLADALDRPVRRCNHRGDCTPACRPALTAGDLAAQLADQLAARGYPATTLGTGIAGGGDGTTSTERAALTSSPWAGVDQRYAQAQRAAWLAATQLDSLHARLLAHADDDDPIPAGRGHCLACETFCLGDGNDRLRGGFCHACASALVRWRIRHPMGARSDFVRDRRKWLTDRGQLTPTDQAVGA